MSVTKTVFGQLPNGEEVFCYTIANQSGASASVLTYGATLQSLCVPNRGGGHTDVVLGYDTLEEYQKNVMYLGATIGRVGNRIAKARFTLNGREYRLAANNNEQCLHGGRVGFDKKNWTARTGDDSVALSLNSPDGDENFPGNLTVTVVFSLSDRNALSIRYFAVSDQDTILNLTNHSYFNLAGQGAGTVLDQTLMIDADRITRIDAHIVPTGEIVPVSDGPLDFRKAKPIGRDIGATTEKMDAARGYDHNFVLNHKKGGVELVARAANPAAASLWTCIPISPACSSSRRSTLPACGAKVGSNTARVPRFASKRSTLQTPWSIPNFRASFCTPAKCSAPKPYTPFTLKNRPLPAA